MSFSICHSLYTFLFDVFLSHIFCEESNKEKKNVIESVSTHSFTAFFCALFAFKYHVTNCKLQWNQRCIFKKTPTCCAYRLMSGYYGYHLECNYEFSCIFQSQSSQLMWLYVECIRTRKSFHFMFTFFSSTLLKKSLEIAPIISAFDEWRGGENNHFVIIKLVIYVSL